MINRHSIYCHDIAKYFEAKSLTDFINRLHSEDKQGRAYSYFECEFDQEVFYHNVSKFSKICINPKNIICVEILLLHLIYILCSDPF